jgi:DNA-binding response OmpR family regulator
MSAELTPAPLFAAALLVEDEVDLATALRIALRKLGIQCSHASTLQQARKAIAQGSGVDFVLLDRALPDGDGIELCSELRRDGSDCAILMLTAKGDTSDRVKGLDQGADDYLSKPFSWEELEARIRALARRRRPVLPAAAPPSPVPSWELDLPRLRIRRPGADTAWVVLTPLEFKLASRLIEAKGAIVSREDLLKDVWGFKFLPQTRTVDHFLGRLRRHFELDPEKPAHFLTVRGAGYRFEV